MVHAAGWAGLAWLSHTCLVGALGPRSETMLPKCGASRASASPRVVLNCQGASLQLWGRGWEQPATGEWPRVQWAAGGGGAGTRCLRGTAPYTCLSLC